MMLKAWKENQGMLSAGVSDVSLEKIRAVSGARSHDSLVCFVLPLEIARSGWTMLQEEL